MPGHLIEPPFDSDNIAIYSAGHVSVYLSDDAVAAIQEIDLSDWTSRDGDWIDGLSWRMSLPELVAEFVDAYIRPGEQVVDVKDKPELFRLAVCLEEAAAMIRSVQFADLDEWDTQFPAVSTHVGVQRIGWKPYPSNHG